MFLPTDLHIHSKYARAVSPQMTLENLDLWGRIKGLGIIGTGDFTYPAWMQEIQQKLAPAAPGLFRLKEEWVKTDWNVPHSSQPYFLLTTEVACIYSKGGKVRKIHYLIFAPTIEAAEKINARLDKIGNLSADGRPILGLESKKLLEIVLDASPDCMLVPAHAWTPWFGIFGSKSGFDSLSECFEELTPHIYAIETGLSSDPPMNWRMEFLDHTAIVSFSDPHSLPRLARETTVFEMEPSYFEMVAAIKEQNRKSFLYTTEFFPAEGKYHFDGHRFCKVSFSPAESRKLKNICPVCHRPLTIGVLNRVEELADRPVGYAPDRIGYRSLVPLEEIIAESLQVGKSSKKIGPKYRDMIHKLGSELHILLQSDLEEVDAAGFEIVAEGIRKVRIGEVRIEPGSDGEYGKIHLFENLKKEDRKKAVAPKSKAQPSLF